MGTATAVKGLPCTTLYQPKKNEKSWKNNNILVISQIINFEIGFLGENIYMNPRFFNKWLHLIFKVMAFRVD